MALQDRNRFEETLRLARELAAKLGPLTSDPSAPDALALRLAQAHALGLVDQLSEIVEVRALRSAESVTRAVAVAGLATIASDDIATVSA